MHWVAHFLGFANGQGNDTPYLFWSGFFGDVGLVTAAVVFLRHRNCHARGCWRLGRHQVDGTPYVTCARHHPDVPNRGPRAHEIRSGG